MPKRNTIRREFSYTRPIMYQGEYYPSADSIITDENGRQIKGRIFTDASGQYYTLDANRNIVPVIPMNNLDEITASANRKRTSLEDALGRSLVMGNDNTRVNNLPHRQYNTYLKENAERGAREHALWDKNHPNLSAWRDVATVVPFAVAATPFVVGGGSALLNTGLGQVARQGFTTLMNNPYVAGINDAIGLGFAGKGFYDVSQGKFTPETALDIAGGYGLMFKGFNSLEKFAQGRRAAKNAMEANDMAIDPEGLSIMEDLNAQRAEELRSASQGSNTSSRVTSQPSTEDDDFYELFDYPERRNSARSSDITGQVETTEDNTSAVVPYLDDMLTSRPNIREEAPISSLDRARADENARGIFNRTLQEHRAVQENPAPARLLDDYDNSVVQPNGNVQNITSSVQDTQELPFFPDGTPNPNYHFTPSETVTSMTGGRTFELSKDKGPLEPMPQQSDYLADNMDSYWNDLWSWERRNNRPLRTRDANERPYTDEEINSLFNENGTLKDEYNFEDFDDIDTGAHGMESWVHSYDSPKKVLQKYFLSFENAQKEREDIGLANRLQGKSGIGIYTHNGDTSIDSTPLLYLKLARGVKRFHPIKADTPTVSSNGLGVQGLFPGLKDSSVQRAKKLLKDNPDADVRLINDANGNMIAFELEDADGVFQIPINSREQVLDSMNKRLHLLNNKLGTSYPDIVPQPSFFSGIRPWHYGDRFILPNIKGIAYKKGGKLKRRLLTQF